jgi:PAS domain S-box-containing protein
MLQSADSTASGSDEPELLLALLDLMPVMVVWWEAHGQLRRLNRSFHEETGWSTEAAAATDLVAACFPDADIRAQVLDHRARSGGGWRDFPLATRDGRRLWTSWTFTRLADGSFLGLGVDVTERREAEATARRLNAVLESRVAERTRQLADTNAVLETEQARLRQVLDRLFAFVGVLTPDGVLIEANHAPLEAAGLTIEDVIGKPFWDCFWWSYDPAVQAQLQAAVARAAAGETPRYDVPVRMRGGALMTIDFQLAPLRDASGRITHLIPSAVDVTERERSKAALRESEALARAQLAELEALYDQAPIGLALIDRELRFVRINRHLAEINGPSVTEHLGRVAWDVLPDLREAAEPLLRQVLSTGEPITGIEFTGETPKAPGVRRSWVEQFYPLKDASGEALAVGIICQEVTAQKQAEAQRELLLRELSHRVKNMLALVQAIARQTGLRIETVPEFLATFGGRLGALSAAHELITATGWEGAHLRALVSRALASHLALGTEQLSLSIEDATLDAALAQNLTLALHELATNAVKHGALATPHGHVSVEGRVEDHDLVLAWRETGGPPVTLPARQGFGMMLLNQVITGQHKGRVDLDWRPEGLVCTLRLPRGG